MGVKQFITLIILFIFFLCGCNKSEQEGEYFQNPESVALGYFVKELVQNGLITSYEGSNIGIDTAVNSKLNELFEPTTKYFADTMTCLLTSSAFLQGYDVCQQDNHLMKGDLELLEGDFNKKSKQGFSLESVAHPTTVDTSKWSKFINASVKNSVFLNVRRHLNFADRELVQIDLIFIDQVQSSQIHSFYFFIKDRTVYSYDYIENGYFDELNFEGAFCNEPHFL